MAMKLKLKVTVIMNLTMNLKNHLKNLAMNLMNNLLEFRKYFNDNKSLIVYVNYASLGFYVCYSVCIT